MIHKLFLMALVLLLEVGCASRSAVGVYGLTSPTRSLSISLREDGTMAEDMKNTAGSAHYDGTWKQEGGEISLSVQRQNSVERIPAQLTGKGITLRAPEGTFDLPRAR